MGSSKKFETPKSTCITVFEKAHPLVTLCNTSSRNTRGKKKNYLLWTPLLVPFCIRLTILHKGKQAFYRKAQCARQRHSCQNQLSMECLPGRICHIQTHSLCSTYIDTVSWGDGGKGKGREWKRRGINSKATSPIGEWVLFFAKASRGGLFINYHEYSYHPLTRGAN